MRSFILAIDPGTTASGVVLMNATTYLPLYAEKLDNKKFLDTVADILPGWPHDENVEAVIEMVGHYGTGMPVGREIFDTCIWIGRFWQKLEALGIHVETMIRKAVVATICGSARANDAHVHTALCDRFAFGQPNFGKGTKSHPGWFYGFRADIWQAYALGTAYLDSKKIQEQNNG